MAFRRPRMGASLRALSTTLQADSAALNIDSRGTGARLAHSVSFRRQRNNPPILPIMEVTRVPWKSTGNNRLTRA
jgi:hypothetical protein